MTGEARRKVSVVGATGSIGTSTADVVRHHPGRFEVVGLAAHHNVEGLLQQIAEFDPSDVALVDHEAARRLRDSLPGGARCRVHEGQEGVQIIAGLPENDVVVCAATGAAGIPPVLSAIEAGKVVALANKEVLVACGAFITALARERGATLLPVDSEHSAIFQCLRGERTCEVRAVILTASGGPFRTFPMAELEQVTRDQALKHPNWDMGAKITIDSASMMNKGLEVIEAHWLFGLPYSQVEVVVHPQSLVHSMVEFVDGSIIAQLGTTDMRIPIQFALTYPERWRVEQVPRLDMARTGTLTFEPPDLERFRCLALAFRCGREGGTYPAVLNAANEVAVGQFLHERIAFLDIPRVIEDVLDAHDPHRATDLETILEADRWARENAEGAAARRMGRE